jgi:hypothetical protein
MKQYRATMTIDVFIDADSEDEADEKFQDMEMIFKVDDVEYGSDLIDWEIEDVVD